MRAQFPTQTHIRCLPPYLQVRCNLPRVVQAAEGRLHLEAAGAACDVRQNVHCGHAWSQAEHAAARWRLQAVLEADCFGLGQPHSQTLWPGSHTSLSCMLPSRKRVHGARFMGVHGIVARSCSNAASRRDCPGQQCVMLDADNVMLRSPAVLLDSAGFASGAPP